MGYYTNFKINLVGKNLTEKDTEKIMEAITLKSSYSFYRLGVLEISSNDEIKWYDHVQHLTKISIDYPSIPLKLVGVGEEEGDHWVKYFRNGKMKREEAEVSFPDAPDWFTNV